MGGRSGSRLRHRLAQVAPDAGPTPQTLERQTRFLECLVECDGNILQACKRARISRMSHYHWLDHDATYKSRYDFARQVAFDQMESELIDRTKTSDMLFRFALETRFPEVYGKRVKLEGGAALTVLDPEKLKDKSEEEIEAAIKFAESVTATSDR